MLLLDVGEHFINPMVVGTACSPTMRLGGRSFLFFFFFFLQRCLLCLEGSKGNIHTYGGKKTGIFTKIISFDKHNILSTVEKVIDGQIKVVVVSHCTNLNIPTNPASRG